MIQDTKLLKAIQQLPFDTKADQALFIEEIYALQCDQEIVHLVDTSSVTSLYYLFNRIEADLPPFLNALQKEPLLPAYFKRFFAKELSLPKGGVASHTFIDLCANNLSETYLERLLVNGWLDQIQVNILNVMQVASLSNLRALIDFLEEESYELAEAEIELGLQVLLLLYPSTLDESAGKDFREFLAQYWPLFMARFEEKIEKKDLYNHIDRPAEWFLLWRRHRRKEEEDLPADDPYFAIDFEKIIKYIPEFIWWNNGLTYRNNDKCYHFGSAEFRHLATGGSVRKGPDQRPYTRRMAKAFVTLPFDFEQPDWDLYIYFFAKSLGAEGTLLELLQEYIIHPENPAAIQATFDAWNPVIQKLMDINFNMLHPRDGRAILGYLYHCIRDNPDYSVQGKTLDQIEAESNAFHQRIQERAQDREARREVQLALYEERRKAKLVTYWAPHSRINSFEQGHKHGKWYRIIELTNENLLSREGSIMGHCVGSYSNYCKSGTTSIWSLRQLKKEKWYSLVTIEIRGDTIVQARGQFNSKPTADHRKIIDDWAKKEGIVWAAYAY